MDSTRKTKAAKTDGSARSNTGQAGAGRPVSHPASLLGEAITRIEDAALLTGRAAFTADIDLPGACHVAFFRSDYACGSIESLDLSAAVAAPGVVAVFSGDDVAGLGDLAVNTPLPVRNAPSFPVLASDRVLAVGQPVAAVVARTAHEALDAVERVTCVIRPGNPTLPGQRDSRLPPDADGHGNMGKAVISSRRTQGQWTTTAEQAAHVVTASVSHPRLLPSPMENRGVAVDVGGGQGVRVWLGSQAPHRARVELARITGIPVESLRIMTPCVGGAFGMKASLYPEEVLVVWAACQLGQSLRWSATRGEDMLSATHGRGATSTGALALDDSGRFLGLQALIDCPLGHWLPTSAAVPAWNASRILPGPYRVPVLDVRCRATVSNTAAVGIYRGAGRPEAAALVERLVDKAALACGLSALDIRERNLLQPDELPRGDIADPGNYPDLLAALKSRAGLDAKYAALAKRRSNGELVGTGIAFYVEPSGQGMESARVTRHANGRIEVAFGGSTQGQGRHTACAQIVADVFGVPMDSIDVLIGDTALCPPGIGALASRSTPIGGSAVLRAAQELLEQCKQADAAPGGRQAVSVTVCHEAAAEAWGYGCYVAQVCIDEQTGKVTVESIDGVDDAGRQVNPMLVAGQVSGGIAQGLGEALMEQVVLDDSGQLLTGSLMDYALPRAADMPPVNMTSLESCTPVNPLGARGVGEAGTIGAPAAIQNAVYDALASRGITGIDLPLPLTPERVWQALKSTVPASGQKTASG